MKIPAVRERLYQKAEELNDPELAALADQLWRRFHGRGPVVSRPITQEVISRVHDLHRENPEMAYHQIGERLRISGGRVSEIIHGKRT